MSADPTFESERSGDDLRLKLRGRWTVQTPGIEQGARALVEEAATTPRVDIDLSEIEAMDTAGAWLIDRSRSTMESNGVAARVEGARREYSILLDEAKYRETKTASSPHGFLLIDFLVQIGSDVAAAFRDLFNGMAFLGQVVATLAKAFTNPRRLRFTSVVYHMETFGLRGVPIVLLINFVVGCIVAQQGIYQLRRFGATTYAIDLIGILVLRDLAVLLTSIMVAGRSGSSITAELGSMKMREEIDAMRVMGLDPIEILIVPRVLALLLCVPLLTFIADMAAIFGGLLVSWVYGGITPAAFTSLLKDAIDLHTFIVGLVKAPFMALVIAMIASVEGLAVQGSAESLGRQVTASVVKSIFMVVVVDGLFAFFFASIQY
jgi:phospholipid/cholesterol/gamma-HCH transport system permease protein